MQPLRLFRCWLRNPIRLRRRSDLRHFLPVRGIRVSRYHR
ncbi:Uncharacterised protein [Vibrio cholerae]|nr:Uncharacterised protein [Vibrio cholerae]